MTLSKKQRGQRGEQLATEYLQDSGYDILTRNWRCPVGELDIIAQRGNTRIFVEVRTRRSASAAFESITDAKRKKLIKLAHMYLSEQKLPENTLWRIDVIAVVLRSGHKPLIEHAEDALGW